MKKSILVIFCCVLCIVLFQAFSIGEKPAYQNLQILPKDISEHDLDSVMHHFSQSLGVKCNFCHVWNNDTKKMNFVTDEKPEKNIARKMMLMSIDINKNYFTAMEMDEHMQGEKHEMDSMNNDHKDSTHKHMDMEMHHNIHKEKMDSTAAMNNVGYMLTQVNCYTCHRGAAHPDSKIPPRPEAPPPPPKPADKK